MKTAILRGIGFAVIAIALLPALGRAAGSPASAESPFSRIVMIGASASAGFTAASGSNAPKSEDYRLSRYLDAALLSPHEPIKNLANAFFFFSAESTGRGQVDRLTELRPTLVMGVDFLFWFCYGQLNDGETRAARFEKGLKLLDGVTCPLLLGDIPDASGADRNMLPEDLIPKAAELAAANRRLKTWAAGHTNVILLDLSSFMRDAMANNALVVHGRTWAAGQTRALLQPDRLHPSLNGCAALAIATWDAVLTARPALAKEPVQWDPAEVLRLGRQAPPAATNAPSAARAAPVIKQ